MVPYDGDDGTVDCAEQQRDDSGMIRLGRSASSTSSDSAGLDALALASQLVPR
jgi:hypothetical protein